MCCIEVPKVYVTMSSHFTRPSSTMLKRTPTPSELTHTDVLVWLRKADALSIGCGAGFPDKIDVIRTKRDTAPA